MAVSNAGLCFARGYYTISRTEDRLNGRTAKPMSIGDTSVGIAGAGPVAQAFGIALQDCGIPIDCIASRNLQHAKVAAKRLGDSVRAVIYPDLSLRVSHVIIAVTDQAITPVAKLLASPNAKLGIALHTCGTYGPELLNPLNAIGVSCGTIHPLQTIQDATHGAAALRDAPFAVSGAPDAVTWAEAIAAALSGHIVHIHPAGRPFYHAAAVMASNYMAALLDSAEQLMVLAGVPKTDAIHALAPIARTSLENIVRCGPVEALTGPIVRGDAETITRHIQAMDQVDDTISGLYKAAGLRALQMARMRGLPDEKSERVLQALCDPHAHPQVEESNTP
jgi:predicted short-subunit dehydrogenase-like oxidoreductase (DUF2520 family)